MFVMGNWGDVKVRQTYDINDVEMCIVCTRLASGRMLTEKSYYRDYEDVCKIAKRYAALAQAHYDRMLSLMENKRKRTKKGKSSLVS
jgi:hypothetical protein